MLETATWRTHKRKHFALAEEIYRQAGVPMAPEPSRDAGDAEFAAAIAHRVGGHLLVGSIQTATTKKRKSSQRLNAKAWKLVGAADGSSSQASEGLGDLPWADAGDVQRRGRRVVGGLDGRHDGEGAPTEDGPPRSVLPGEDDAVVGLGGHLVAPSRQWRRERPEKLLSDGARGFGGRQPQVEPPHRVPV